jgi:uncharacterized membrane protein
MTWQEATTGTAAMLVFTAIVIVVIAQVAATWRARMAVTKEDAYRLLAEQATQAQEQTARRLDDLTAELSDLRQRTTRMEGLLKEVDEPWTR